MTPRSRTLRGIAIVFGLALAALLLLPTAASGGSLVDCAPTCTGTEARVTPGPIRYSIEIRTVDEHGAIHIFGFTYDTLTQARRAARRVANEGAMEEDQSSQTLGTYWPPHRVVRVVLLEVYF